MSSTKAITIKTSEAAAQAFADALAAEREKNPLVTVGSFFEQLISGGVPTGGNSEDLAQLKERLETEQLTNNELLQELGEEHEFTAEIAKIVGIESAESKENILHAVSFCSSVEKRYKESFVEICESLDLPEEKRTPYDVLNEIKATQQRAMMALQDAEPAPFPENQIMFTIDEPHLALLKATVERLSAKYNATVTMKDVLLDMFARYTIEQYNEWFYPFVINGEDFHKITGFTQKQLKQWVEKK